MVRNGLKMLFIDRLLLPLPVVKSQTCQLNHNWYSPTDDETFIPIVRVLLPLVSLC